MNIFQSTLLYLRPLAVVLVIWPIVASDLNQTAHAAPAFPNIIADDNGDYAFAREVVPLVLGRKPRGAMEIKLLGDIATLQGRPTMVRMLMDTDEYQQHWADVIMDIIRLQKSGYRSQRAACFQDASRLNADGNADVRSALAQFVSFQPADIDVAPPGGDFNMRDLLLSALKEDNISPFIRAYLYPLTIRPGRNVSAEKNLRSAVGSHFTHTYLNRQLGCMGCHNEVYSVTGEFSGWNRTHPVAYMLDETLMGSSYGTLDTNIFNFFRTDQRVAKPADQDFASDAIVPWHNMALDCVICSQGSVCGAVAGFKRPPAGEDNNDVEYADITGDDRFVMDLEDKLRAGVTRIRLSGFNSIEDPDLPHPVPENAEVALAFEVATSFVDLVWEKLIGRKLTIENYFPRNASQRDVLWSLTEDVFLPYWSLKDLITAIVVSEISNRKSPNVSGLTSAYRLPMIMDPWVAKDPRLPATSFDDPNDPKLSNNGQGELVRKHEPVTLFRQAAAALDWAAPNIMNGGYIGKADRIEIGQFWSDDEPGHRGFDMQMMLAWEEKHASCQNPGSGDDWIDRLLLAVDDHNAANPFEPLLIKDVVQTVKDWIIQDGAIQSTPPSAVSSISEVEAIARIFSNAMGDPLPINTPVSVYISFMGEATFENKVRQICGTLLQTPQFMLKGISETGSTLTFPNFRVCNNPDECDYQEMCEVWEAVLEANNHYVRCLPDDVVPEDPPGSGVRFPDIVLECLISNRCGFRLLPECLTGGLPGGIPPGPIVLEDCPIDIPRCDPRCGMGAVAGGLGGVFGDGFASAGFPDPLGGGELGLRCCGGLPDFDPIETGGLLAWLEGAVILETLDVLVFDVEEGLIRPLEIDQKLRFGDILIIPQGGQFTAEDSGLHTFTAGDLPTVGDLRLSGVDRSLFEAIERGQTVGVERALLEGANPNAINANGFTALTLSVSKNQEKAVSMLLEAGAEPNLRDARGNYPLQIAQTRKQSYLSRNLESHGALQLSDAKVNEEPLPRLMLVTGPSASKAPHLSGAPYVSLLGKAPGPVDYKRFPPLSQDEILKLIEKNKVLDREMNERDLEEVEKYRSNIIPESQEDLYQSKGD